MSEAEDRDEIRAVIENFAYAIDGGRLDLLTDTFAPGATMVIGGRQIELGVGDEIGAKFTSAGGIASTTHLRTSQHIELNGDTAHSHTLAMGIIVREDGPVHVRGVSYHDDFERTPAGWRIRHRIHQALWQFDTTSTPPIVPMSDKK